MLAATVAGETDAAGGGVADGVAAALFAATGGACLSLGARR
jgi:hypothetical protein